MYLHLMEIFSTGKSFWEQFCISVHNFPSLSDSEKLVYLQHALKDGSAKRVIEGLSHSDEHYNEAVACLTSRFDRPRAHPLNST